MSDKGNRVIQRTIGETPPIFGIPPDMLVPWSVIFFGTMTLTRMFFSGGNGWEYSIIMPVIGCVAWSIVVGRKSYKFLGKFINPPKRLACSYPRYQPLSPHIRKRYTNARKN
jgi:hypothetical protein